MVLMHEQLMKHNKDFHYIYIYVSVVLLAIAGLWNSVNENRGVKTVNVSTGTLVFGSLVTFVVVFGGVLARRNQLNRKMKFIPNHYPK